MNIDKIFGTVIILLGIFMIVISINSLLTFELGTFEVDCYDRHNNKITGLVCEKEVTLGDTIFGSILIFVVGIMVIIMGITWRKFGKHE